MMQASRFDLKTFNISQKKIQSKDRVAWINNGYKMSLKNIKKRHLLLDETGMKW
jgi:hypothetical protein